VRQQFCLRHKSIWLISIICVAVGDLIVVLRAVHYETTVPGAVLGAFTIAYLAINHAHSEIWETIPLKEFTIASLFAAGTLLGVTPHVFTEGSTMIFAAILFATLCSLNCVSIAIGTGSRSDSGQVLNRDALGACEFSPAASLAPLAGGFCRAIAGSKKSPSTTHCNGPGLAGSTRSRVRNAP
jgi:hypothetical protein